MLYLLRISCDFATNQFWGGLRTRRFSCIVNQRRSVVSSVELSQIAFQLLYVCLPRCEQHYFSNEPCRKVCVPVRFCYIPFISSESESDWYYLFIGQKCWFKNPDCSVGIKTGYRLDVQGSIPGRGKIFLFSTASRLALGPTKPPVGTRACFLGG